MSYYVVWPDGRRFGPADLATLHQWAADGRIAPDTQIEDVVAGTTGPASLVAGLEFPEPEPPPSFAASPPPPRAEAPSYSPGEAPHLGDVTTPGPERPLISADNPYALPPGAGAPFPQAGTGTVAGASDLTWAWVLYAVGFVCFCGCVAQVPGLAFAYQAKSKGNPGAKVAVIVGWVLLFLNFAGFVVSAILSRF